MIKETYLTHYIETDTDISAKHGINLFFRHTYFLHTFA